MAFTDSDSSNMIMPVAPMGGYAGNNGGFFGGDGWWLILLLLCFNNGGWGGFGGGYGAMMGADFGGFGLYPWLNNSQNINGGFRDQMLGTTIQGIQNSITSGFGDVQLGIAGVNQNICQTGNGIVNAVTGAQNAITAQMYNNTIADLERSFASQTATTAGMNSIGMSLQANGYENRAATADLKYTVATEACADRAAVGDALQNITMQNMGNTNAIVNALRDGIQSIKDDLCADRLDAERRENANLRSELMYARGQASQVEQTAQIRNGQATVASQLVSELRSCPIPSQPVYGNQPIFTCGGNNFGGCGCGVA